MVQKQCKNVVTLHGIQRDILVPFYTISAIYLRNKFVQGVGKKKTVMYDFMEHLHADF
jgi:hypothetical protein